MKRVFILLVIIIAVTMSSCSVIEDGIQAAFGGNYDDGYEDGYDKGYDDGYDRGYSEPKQVKRPTSGTILEGKEYYESNITVEADSYNNYVVTLKDTNGTVLVSFFVRSGAKVTVGVPAKNCYVYFASGNNWYGYGEGLMFGKDTYYSMDDELIDFGDGTWTYTMKSVTNGNFSVTPIDQDEFFF